MLLYIQLNAGFQVRILKIQPVHPGQVNVCRAWDHKGGLWQLGTQFLFSYLVQI